MAVVSLCLTCIAIKHQSWQVLLSVYILVFHVDLFPGVVPYYIVRNSWGTEFGHDGYLYIRIGDNVCGELIFKRYLPEIAALLFFLKCLHMLL